MITQSAIGNQYGFTGRRYEPETRLYYYRAKYYSPSIGRFLQTDPLGYIDSMNLYSYVNNNSVNYIDPLGLCSKRKKQVSKKIILDKLTLKQANKHWREGKGETLYVNIKSLDLSNVSTAELTESDLVSFTGKHFSSINDALVYGTVVLKKGPGNIVVGGFDTYDFDIKPWSRKTFIRNIETKIGSWVAGKGVPYNIEFVGTAKLGKKER